MPRRKESSTDLYPKIRARPLARAASWHREGAGMIEPNLATMLVIFDGPRDFPAPSWPGMLARAIDASF